MGQCQSAHPGILASIAGIDKQGFFVAANGVYLYHARVFAPRGIGLQPGFYAFGILRQNGQPFRVQPAPGPDLICKIAVMVHICVGFRQVPQGRSAKGRGDEQALAGAALWRGLLRAGWHVFQNAMRVHAPKPERTDPRPQGAAYRQGRQEAARTTCKVPVQSKFAYCGFLVSRHMKGRRKAADSSIAIRAFSTPTSPETGSR